MKGNWPVLLACFLGLSLAVGTVMTYASGIFLTAIGNEFGWSRVGRALPMMGFYYASVVGSLLCGILIDAVGPRKVITVSTTLLAVGLAGFATLPGSQAKFAIAFGGLAFVALGTLPISYVRVIISRFDRQRGLALGITLTGVGVGGAVLPILVQTVIEASGWRTAYLVLAALVAVLSLPSALLFIRPARDAEPERANAASFGQALRERPAVLSALGAISLLSGVVLTGLVVHLVPILRERGLDGLQAARLAGLMGLAIITGRLGIGVLMDHFRASRMLGLFLLGPVFGALLLAEGGPQLLPVAAILIGLAQGAEVDAVAFLVSRHFSRAHFGLLYGLMFALFTAGAANGPLILAWVSGSGTGYALALAMAAMTAAAVSLIAFCVPAYPPSDQQTVRA